jgi:hypothetical protein
MSTEGMGLPWEVVVGPQACFHDGNRVSIVTAPGEIVDEDEDGTPIRRVETVAECWPGDGGLDERCARLIVEAVNGHDALLAQNAALAARVARLEAALRAMEATAYEVAHGLREDATGASRIAGSRTSYACKLEQACTDARVALGATS